MNIFLWYFTSSLYQRILFQLNIALQQGCHKKKIRFYLLPVPLCQICFVFGFDLTKSQSSKSISNGYGPNCHRIFKRLKCLNILSSLPHETRASETRNKLSAFSDKKGDVPFLPQLNDHSEYSFGTFT